MTTESIINEIAAERRRQVDVEGFDAQHDRHHANSSGALAYAAGCYADEALWHVDGEPPLWPWEPEWWKPKDRRRNLVRSAALALAHHDAIVAEIERLDRAEGRQ